jgi:putative FmdB family regulatory protein
MPLYEYKCSECGVFDEWKTIAEYNKPANCPTCQKQATRLFSPPMLLNSSLRLSKKANPEPQLIQKSGIEPNKSKLSSHPEGRPWMISH